MSLTLHIPTWLLWTLGIPLALVVLVCAALGLWLLLNLKNMGPRF